ncbi:MAG: ATP-binding protein [Nitrospirota bacterium]
MNSAPRILLIDDSPQLRELAIELLEKEFPDFQIDAIAGPDELAQALEAGGFCLVVTDYYLGWTDGLAVLRDVKAGHPDCPVIMFTGTGSEEIAVEAMKAGLDDYVLKSPKHVGRLAASVRHALEQVEQRRQLREVEARNRSLVQDVLDTSPIGIIILDAQLTVVWLNAALERFFGLRRDEAIGTDKRQLIRQRIKQVMEHPDQFAQTVLETYERGNHVASFECHVLAGEGRDERWLEHRSLPIRTGPYAGGRIEHYYDITERKQMEVQASRFERMAALGQLLGGIAHELKNPLFVLTGYVQLVQEKLANREYEAVSSDLLKVAEAAGRLGRITDRFQELARPYQPKQEWCNMGLLLDRALEHLANELMKNNVRVMRQPLPDLPAVWGDPRLLQEVFLNLMLNAMQAMNAAHGKGTLTVSATLVADAETRRRGDAAPPPPSPPPSEGEGKEGGDWIEVRIQDDGPGIPPEHRAKLFEPFFSTKPVEQGTGLGLWTVRSIVMAMKGTVTFETEIGRGTTFIVRLPVAGEPTRGHGDTAMR